MCVRMNGVETEYCFASAAPNGSPLERSQSVNEIMKCALTTLPHIREGGSHLGMFLGTGGRFYVDAGNHIELTTPECTDPADSVRYIVAGDRMLESLSKEYASNSKTVGEAFFFKSNVDYSGLQTTCGCHESYLHRADRDKLSAQIVPHLVSRCVYAGAGGFDNRALGLKFVLSPRMPHMTAVVSAHSTQDRGIFHTKNEPLCSGGYQRLHLLCGESLMGHFGMWLKAATTSLIPLLVEKGVRFRAVKLLRNPLVGLRSFAGDPSCTATATTATAAEATAIQIQRAYLEEVEEHIGRHFMPGWAVETCIAWRETLDKLEEDPRSMGATLDWRIKYELYTDYIRERGYTWKDLDRINALTGAFEAAQPEHASVLKRSPHCIPSRREDESKTAFKDFLDRHDGDWETFVDFWNLRNELFEIDTRFSMLSPDGIFRAMDAEGVLHHCAPGVDNIDHAISNPPVAGRARLRGTLVKESFARGNSSDYRASWSKVVRISTREHASLSHPFCRELNWEQPVLDGVEGAVETAGMDTLTRMRLRRLRALEDSDCPF